MAHSSSNMSMVNEAILTSPDVVSLNFTDLVPMVQFISFLQTSGVNAARDWYFGIPLRRFSMTSLGRRSWEGSLFISNLDASAFRMRSALTCLKELCSGLTSGLEKDSHHLH